LFLFIAAALGLLAGFVFYRTKVQAPLAAPEKTDFDLAATAQVGAVVATGELDPAAEFVAVPEPYQPPAQEPAEEVGLVPEPEPGEEPGRR
jgi:hypothetical protein